MFGCMYIWTVGTSICVWLLLVVVLLLLLLLVHLWVLVVLLLLVLSLAVVLLGISNSVSYLINNGIVTLKNFLILLSFFSTMNDSVDAKRKTNQRNDHVQGDHAWAWPVTIIAALPVARVESIRALIAVGKC